MKFVATKNTIRLSKQIANYFGKLNWLVAEEINSDETMLRLRKNDIIIFIKVIDSELQFSLGLLTLLDRLEALSQEYHSRTGYAVTYFVENRLLGLDDKVLIERGIAIVSSHELALLSDLERLYNNPEIKISQLEKLIMRGCRQFCIALSDRAMKAGNIEAAKNWLKLNIDGVFVVVESHLKLVDILISNKEFDEAREIIEKALVASPSSVNLLKRLRRIEVQLGNAAVLESIDERIEIASVRKPSFETLLERQSASSDRRLSIRREEGGARTESKFSLKRWLVRRD